jgi:hypothetical protein
VTKRKLLSFSLVIACSLFLLGCSGSGGGGGGSVNVNGTVVGLTFSPISNASVVIGSSTARTRSNGTYSFTNIPGGDQKITITSAGHTSSYRKVSVSSGQTATASIAILADLDSKITPITASGGTAANTIGSIKMIFPSGAFSSRQNVILTQVPKVAAPYDPQQGQEFISFIVFVEPENVTLSAAATLEIPNMTGVTTEAVPFYHFDPNSLTWNFIGNGFASATSETMPTATTIDISTIRMGWIAAMIPIDPLPGQISGVVSIGHVGGTPISGANVWSDNSSAVSDSTGHYILNYVPTGIATVNASAVSYDLYTSPPQTVLSTLTTPLNIPLSQASQGNVSGTVRRFGGGSGSIVQNARIVGSNGGEAITDSNGTYTLYNIPAAPTHFTASALNYVSSVETATVESGTTIPNVDFSLPYVGTFEPYEFTFESATMEGFTTEPGSFWHVQFCDHATFTGRPVDYFNSAHPDIVRQVFLQDDGILTQNGCIPTPYQGDYYAWYGQTTPATAEGSFIGLYETNFSSTSEVNGGTSGSPYVLGDSGSLISPPLDLTGYDNGELNFWTWWEIESADPANGHDSMDIYVATGPTFSTWEALGSLNPLEDPIEGGSGEAYTSGGFDQPGVWVNHVFDLSSYSGKRIEIKFKFDTVDRDYNGFRGWFLDDIKVNNSQFGVAATSNHRTTIPKVLPRKPRN